MVSTLESVRGASSYLLKKGISPFVPTMHDSEVKRYISFQKESRAEKLLSNAYAFLKLFGNKRS